MENSSFGKARKTVDSLRRAEEMAHWSRFREPDRGELSKRGGGLSVSKVLREYGVDRTTYVQCNSERPRLASSSHPCSYP
jgi:hypothetical protein